ncbi:B12-binding domain-containing radical SAM protein [Chloroflexota bacterium]
MTDLMLVNPLFLHEDPVEQRLMTPYFPLGLLYLAATARDAGYRVSIFDAMFQASDEAFVAALEREQPKVVGIGVLATVRTAALRLADLAHRHGAMVVVGGADPTGRPESYLRRQSNGSQPVDMAVVGEGEQTLLELLPLLLNGERNDEPLQKIAGLAYLDADDHFVSTAARRHCADLESLALPARDLIDVEAYRQAWHRRHGIFSLSLIATRGCPYGCTWCQKSVFGRSFRPRSPQAVAEEMRLIKEQYRPDQLRIVDDVMGIDREWVRAWHTAVLARDAVVPFECLSRVDLMDEEMVRLLQEAGCIRIAFGAESGSQKVLDAMNKGTTVEQIRRTAKLCRRHDIETYFYIMVGYPGEEWVDIRKTVDLLKEARPDQFSSTIAYPLPGTEFYDEVKHRLLDAPDWDYTAENRLLFQREHSTRFYRWVQRWFHQEWHMARLRHDQEQATPGRWVRRLGGLWTSRAMVHLLRYLPGDTV